MRPRRWPWAARAAVQALAAAIAAGALLEAGLRLAPSFFRGRLELESLRARVLTRRFVPDPELGVAVPAPYAREASWSGGRVRLRHLLVPGGAAVGFRAGAEGADPRRAAVAALGDSHGYGMEVDEDMTWQSHLSRLTGFSVVNLSLPYQGTAQHEAFYRLYGGRFRPKSVLLMVCPNDPWDNEVFAAWRKEGRGEDFRLYKYRTLFGWPLPLARAAFWARKSIVLWQLFFSRRFGSRYDELTERAARAPGGLEGLVEDAARIKALAAAGGASFGVVMTDIWWREAFRPLRAPFKKALRRRGIPVLDLSEALRDPGGRPLELWLPGDIHWNQRGHARVAAEIRAFARSARLLPR